MALSPFSVRRVPALALAALGLVGAGFAASSPAPRFEVEGWEERINARQPPQQVLDTFGVRPGMAVAEVGAGRGRVTVWVAERVGPAGKVWANDIDQGALDHLRERCERAGFRNVTTVLGAVADARLPPATFDLVFMTNTYHHLEKPVELVRSLRPSLKPGGVLAVVERDRDRTTHKEEATSRADFVRQMAEAGFEVFRVETFLSEDNIYLARESRRSR